MDLSEFFLGRVKAHLDSALDCTKDVMDELVRHTDEDVDLDELEELEGAIAEALKMARALVLPEVSHEA